MPCDAPVMTATFLSLLMFVSFILLSHQTLVPVRVCDRCAWDRPLRERCGRVLGQERVSQASGEERNSGPGAGAFCNSGLGVSTVAGAVGWTPMDWYP